MASNRGATNLQAIIDQLKRSATDAQRNKSTIDDEVPAGEEAGPVDDPLSPKKPQSNAAITNIGKDSLTGENDVRNNTSKSEGFQETVEEEEVPSDKEQEVAHFPSQVESQQRPTKKGASHVPSESSRPKAVPPFISLSQSGTSAKNRGNNGNEDHAVSSSPSSPRKLGPRSWIVRCTEINDLVAADLSRLCVLKGQVQELLSLSSQLVSSDHRWSNWVSLMAEAETDQEEEDFDFRYNERLQRLAAEPDVLVDELRVLQKALGTTLPPTRRVSVVFAREPGSPKAAKAGMSENGTSSSAATASTSTSTSTSRRTSTTGTYEDLEGLRTRWASLSKRVIALSSHLDKIVKAAVVACRKSGAHPERPALVAKLKQLVAEAQPGTIYKQYEEVGLGQVIQEVYPQGRPELEISSDDGLRGQKKSAAALVLAAATEALRAVPIPGLDTAHVLLISGACVFEAVSYCATGGAAVVVLLL
ncbi:hypothetical protein PG993_009578 [Apiospora rasikravindrae]|uniref:Uncharacterized protein n=1 Tax=Apiospora rasikravindrae TaxID=990691 RepID=A0ABR1SJS0_9PEZI